MEEVTEFMKKDIKLEWNWVSTEKAMKLLGIKKKPLFKNFGTMEKFAQSPLASPVFNLESATYDNVRLLKCPLASKYEDRPDMTLNQWNLP